MRDLRYLTVKIAEHYFLWNFRVQTQKINKILYHCKTRTFLLVLRSESKILHIGAALVADEIVKNTKSSTDLVGLSSRIKKFSEFIYKKQKIIHLSPVSDY